MFTLSSRSAVAAVDGAPVPDTAIFIPQGSQALVVASFAVVTHGGPTTYTVRAAIEMSIDGGTTWHQVVRFKDITDSQTKNQVVRASSSTSVAETDVVASDLTGAAAAAVVTDTPWLPNLRAVTMVQALSGGVTPSIDLIILLSTADS